MLIAAPAPDRHHGTAERHDEHRVDEDHPALAMQRRALEGIERDESRQRSPSLRRATCTGSNVMRDSSVGSYSDRSACSTSTREARAAGISDATMAAATSTTAAPTTGSAPGICTVDENLAATPAST